MIYCYDETHKQPHLVTSNMLSEINCDFLVFVHRYCIRQFAWINNDIKASSRRVFAASIILRCMNFVHRIWKIKSNKYCDKYFITFFITIYGAFRYIRLACVGFQNQSKLSIAIERQIWCPRENERNIFNSKVVSEMIDQAKNKFKSESLFHLDD